jgi:hypothetical protein
MMAPRVPYGSSVSKKPDVVPAGWTKYDNLFRQADSNKMSKVQPMLPVKDQCAAAIRKGYNAFVVVNDGEVDRVFYIQYGAKLTAKDCMPVVDATVALYVFNQAHKSKKIKLSPCIDYSCCGKMYLMESTEISCLRCDRSFHVSCVLKELDIDESLREEWLNAYGQTWKCKACCKKPRVA